MRLALISDVHANASALDRVLVAIEDESPDCIICLGDLVGYNAEPIECLERIREVGEVVIAGNHDWDIGRGDADEMTHGVARESQRWTRAQLDDEQLRFLATLPNRHVGEGYVAVHGCYLNPEHVTGYVTSTMLPNNLETVRDHPAWSKVAFCGHSHQPLIGWLQAGRVWEPPFRGQVTWPKGADVVLINPGSVGQPRDRDTRAAYAIIDLKARSATLRRIDYDIQRTADKIVAAGLPRQLAQRLAEGR